MSKKENFIYKGYDNGFMNESAVHILHDFKGENIFFISDACDLFINTNKDDVIEINYKCLVPYKSGQLLFVD